jgi:hypothetical protein
MSAGEGLPSLMSYDPGTGTVPIAATLRAGIPALLILLAPLVPPCSTVTAHTVPGARLPGCQPG